MKNGVISKVVVNCCFNIHKQYGPGLFESVYEEIICYELGKAGLNFKRQQGVRVIHNGVNMGIGFIPDIVIENKVIVELKSVENLAEVHYKQLTTYLKITNLKLGLLVNFNVPLIKLGLHRIVNKL